VKVKLYKSENCSKFHRNRKITSSEKKKKKKKKKKPQQKRELSFCKAAFSPNDHNLNPYQAKSRNSKHPEQTGTEPWADHCQSSESLRNPIPLSG